MPPILINSVELEYEIGRTTTDAPSGANLVGSDDLLSLPVWKLAKLFQRPALVDPARLTDGAELAPADMVVEFAVATVDPTSVPRMWDDPNISAEIKILATTVWALSGLLGQVYSKPAATALPRALSTEAKDVLRDQARDIWLQQTGRRAIWDGLQVHHRIPLEWQHLMPGDPNRLANLVGMAGPDHTLVTNAWKAWKASLGGATPTPSQVLEQALKIDTDFGHLMTFAQ
jgi:hypothetical protein